MVDFIAVFLENYLEKVDVGIQKNYSNLVYLSWMFKPLFGLLADWIFPFGYRTRYYIIVIGLLSIVPTYFARLYAERIKDTAGDLQRANLHRYFLSMALVYSCLAAIGSICRKPG